MKTIQKVLSRDTLDPSSSYQLSEGMLESVTKQLLGKKVFLREGCTGEVTDAWIEDDSVMAEISWPSDPLNLSSVGICGEITSYTRGSNPKVRNFRVDNLVGMSYSISSKENNND